MHRISHTQRQAWPEVLISSKETASRVRAAAAKGVLRRISLRLYTPNLLEDDAAIIRRNLWRVVGLLAPGAVISYRTAIEARPTANNTVYLVGSSRYQRELPGLSLKIEKGPGPQPGDLPFIGSLYMASRSRALLDALRPSRERKGVRRGLFREEVEAVLEREFESGGEHRLNEIRDRARALAPALDASSESQQLSQLISVLLGSRTGPVTHASAAARLAGDPYDSARFALFQKLFEYLQVNPGRSRPVVDASIGWENVSFFDSYFSNFIEGTEFKVEEAREIVFENKIPQSRPSDAHDILGTYAAAGSRSLMSRSILADSNAETFIDRLTGMHTMILQGRTDKRPGQFKTEPNRAGETHFVEPHLVRGTLSQAFEIARGIADPFNRAAAVTFFISEIHPFDDGNGRVARVFMNAELISAGETRIIIPSVYREDYLTGLRVLTRQDEPKVFVDVLDFAQRYVRSIDWSNYELAEAQLRETNAFEQPQAGLRLRMPAQNLSI